MGTQVCHGIKRIMSHRFVRTATVVCCLALLSTACRKQPSDPNVTAAETPPPPDLSQCTRIEVWVEPSALEALVIPPPNEPNVLSAEEVRWIESLETMVIDDPAYIQALAQNVSMSSYGGPRHGGIAIIPVYHVSGQRGEQRLVSFQIKGPVILTEDDHFFRRSLPLRRSVSLTPALDPFRWRLKCARNLRRLWRALGQETERDGAEQTIRQWCDAIAKGRVKDDTLICPSAGKGRCHYAMNRDYKADAPGDTVLLFEAKPGWNQHGGPELFTFDNHDPKGGCVLLNNGMVKFIRTEKELHALRWK